jgi:hypothetical protein
MFLPFRSKHYLRGPYWLGESQINETPNPSWIPGDVIHSETKEIQRTKHQAIVGILDMTNRTRYGFNNHGIPLYMFHPLDVTYPPMIVGCKASNTINQFGIASYDFSAKQVGKWLRGSLQGLIGPVGNEESELTALRTMVGTGKSKLQTVVPSPPSIAEELWDVVMNIDPEGCRDIDDILSWRTMENGDTEFAISIANVASWIAEGDDLDEHAKVRGQTVYEDGCAIQPMLPAELSEAAASLHSDGVARPVISCVWTFKHDGEIIGPCWKSIKIANRLTFTYESILREPTHCVKICDFLERIVGSSVGTDPHEWIEVAMVLYNCKAASILRRVGGGLLRKHESTVSSHNELAEIAKKADCREIAFLGYASGEYVWGATNSKNIAHAGLNKNVYCHASSPLRRYADLANQRVLRAALFDRPGFVIPDGWGSSHEMSPCGFPNLKQLATNLNDRARQIKKFERSVWCMKNLKTDALTAQSGYVLGWKEDVRDPLSVRISIYVPVWKRTVRIAMFRDFVSASECRAISHDGSKTFELARGSSVCITAYTNLRLVNLDERFVFRLD